MALCENENCDKLKYFKAGRLYESIVRRADSITIFHRKEKKPTLNSIDLDAQSLGFHVVQIHQEYRELLETLGIAGAYEDDIEDDEEPVEPLGCMGDEVPETRASTQASTRAADVPTCNSSTGIPIIFDNGTKTAGPSSTDENPN